MAKIVRQTHKVFGNAGSTGNFAKFGSEVAGGPLKTKDIATIQSLPAWDDGFQDALFGGNQALLLEDLNGWAYEHSYQIGSILQDGAPVWDANTTYFIGSYVADPAGSGQQWFSLIDNNTGNAPPVGGSNANWQWANPPVNLVGGSATANTLPKISAAAPTNGVPNSKALVDSGVSDDGTNIILARPLKFAGGTIQSAAAATPVTSQTQPSRVLGTTYQNTGTKPIWVTILVQANGSNFTAYSDANPTPSTVVGGGGAPAPGSQSSTTFIVLAGNYYRTTAPGPTLVSWTEWS